MSTKNILIGCTGSVATIKLFELVRSLQESQISLSIRVVLTEKAKHFTFCKDLDTLGVTYYDESDEWNSWNSIGDPVLHVQLREWADLLIIAPLDANSLGKIASGICDNLLTCVVRAWNIEKPLLFAPAMNTFMYKHPITRRQIDSLVDFGYVEIPCIRKVLACGDEGLGAMEEPSKIAEKVISSVS